MTKEELLQVAASMKNDFEPCGLILHPDDWHELKSSFNVITYDSKPTYALDSIPVYLLSIYGKLGKPQLLPIKRINELVIREKYLLDPNIRLVE
jgi:hypothetical protein